MSDGAKFWLCIAVGLAIGATASNILQGLHIKELRERILVLEADPSP